MQHRLISSTGSNRLILIFAGWGMDATPFAGLCRPGYDIMVVWDYRSLYIDWGVVESYDEICLVAWSMGVFAASQTLQAVDYRITKRIAVNGTVHPVDDRYGIPESIYRGTHDGLSERSLTKFYRRMCVSREQFAEFEAVRPSRGVDELKDELRAIGERTILNNTVHLRWDKAVIGRNDAIMPPLSQQAAWEAAGVRAVMTDDAHMVDFQALLDSEFIDKATMTQRFERGRDTYEANAPVQTEVVDRMAAMLGRHYGRMLAECAGTVIEIGSGSGALSRKLASAAPRAKLALWDISGSMPDGLGACGGRVRFVRCDAELEIGRLSPGTVSCIASASTVQWFNSPLRFMEMCARALVPGGILLLSTFTRGNLAEITALTGHSLPMLEPEEWLAGGSQWFDVIEYASYTRDIDFGSPMEVLRHLKLTGVNSLGAGTVPGAGARDIMRRYPMRLDARYHLTYRPMIMLFVKR